MCVCVCVHVEIWLVAIATTQLKRAVNKSVAECLTRGCLGSGSSPPLPPPPPAVMNIVSLTPVLSIAD